MQARQGRRVIDPEDLRAIDRKLLDYLNEHPVSPSYCQKRLIIEEDMEYSGGYVQERLAHFADHGHAVNLYDSGLYELTEDPRDV